MLGLPVLLLLSLACSALGGDYHTTGHEAAVPASASHSDAAAAVTGVHTDHASTTVHSDVPATTSLHTSADVGGIHTVTSSIDKTDVATTHAQPPAASVHSTQAASTVPGAPLSTSFDATSGVSAVHTSPGAVPTFHSAPAVTSQEGVTPIHAAPALSTGQTASVDASQVTSGHAYQPGTVSGTTQASPPAPIFTPHPGAPGYSGIFQPGPPYGLYYPPTATPDSTQGSKVTKDGVQDTPSVQGVYQPGPTPFGLYFPPTATPDSTQSSKVTKDGVQDTPSVQSAYQPGPTPFGPYFPPGPYFQPSPYLGFAPGLGRPSPYPSGPVFPGSQTDSSAPSNEGGSVLTSVNTVSSTPKDHSVADAYQTSPAAANTYHEGDPAAVPAVHAAPDVSNPQTTDYGTPAVGSSVAVYQPGHGVATTSNSDAAPGITAYQGVHPAVSSIHNTPGLTSIHDTPAAVPAVHASPDVASPQTTHHDVPAAVYQPGPGVAPTSHVDAGLGITAYQGVHPAVSSIHETPGVNPVHDSQLATGYQTSPAHGAVHSSVPAFGTTTVHGADPVVGSLHSGAPALTAATGHEATPAGVGVHSQQIVTGSTAIAPHENGAHGVATPALHQAVQSTQSGVPGYSGIQLLTAPHGHPAFAPYGGVHSVPAYGLGHSAAVHGAHPAFNFDPAYSYGVPDLGYGVAPFSAGIDHAFPHYGLNYAYGVGPQDYNALYIRRRKK